MPQRGIGEQDGGNGVVDGGRPDLKRGIVIGLDQRAPISVVGISSQVLQIGEVDVRQINEIIRGVIHDMSIALALPCFECINAAAAHECVFALGTVQP